MDKLYAWCLLDKVGRAGKQAGWELGFGAVVGRLQVTFHKSARTKSLLVLSCAHSNWRQPHCFAFMMWLNCAVTCPTPAREEGFKMSLMWSDYLQQGFTGTLSRSKEHLKRHCWFQGLSTQHLTGYTSHSQKMCVWAWKVCFKWCISASS